MTAPKIRSDAFIHLGPGHWGIDASNLPGRGLARIDGTKDVGLVMISARSGIEVTFVVASVDRDQEGEITGWNLVPLGQVPPVRAIRVKVFNT
jgi:hypothetical protein